MKILFYSDPHLGLSRTSHTTPKSAARLRASLFDSAKAAIMAGQAAEVGMTVCLGDLFDTYSNSEATLQQAIAVMSETDLTLAGNHDLRNSKDAVSSLQLLSELFPGKVVVNAWGETEPTYTDVGRARLMFVPHVRTQEDFDAALDEAVASARDSLKWNVLCLHCNIGMEERNLPETSLNLSMERAKQLLLTFHRIFIGHEHQPRELFGDRLIVLGNTHPTGFADISDKRAMMYDTELNEVEFIPLCSLDSSVWRGKISALPETGTWRFLDLEDDLEPGAAFRRVSKLFSAADSPFCIRLTSPEAKRQGGDGVTLESVSRLPEEVSANIEKDHPELLPLWKELLDAA